MEDLAKPQFVASDAAQIVAEMKAYYEQLTGRVLHPGQSEMLLLNAAAYREVLLRAAINHAGQQMLVSYSQAPVLDYLGELVGVTRLAAKRASTTMRFHLVPGHKGVVVPQGLRVQSKDGQVYFSTNYQQAVAEGVAFVDVLCDCNIEGKKGNGYLAGEITEILDPQAYITTAANLAETAGGAEQEPDEQLRTRIKQAPASFSNAGSSGAYIYHAKSANPAIIDVAVTNPVAGTVKIYPLVAGGIVTPAEVLADVAETCTSEKVRPLTDTVLVEAPTRLDYALTVNLTLYPTAIQSAVVQQVNDNLGAFTAARAAALGRDIVSDQLKAVCMVEGVYKADLVGFADIVVDNTSYAFCTGLNVNVTAINNG